MPSHVTENSKSSSWINWLFEATWINRLSWLKNISEQKRPLWPITFQGNRKMYGKKFVTEKWPSGTRLFCTQDVILCRNQQWPLFVPWKPKHKVKIGSGSTESWQILPFIASNNNNKFKIQLISLFFPPTNSL